MTFPWEYVFMFIIIYNNLYLFSEKPFLINIYYIFTKKNEQNKRR